MSSETLNERIARWHLACFRHCGPQAPAQSAVDVAPSLPVVRFDFNSAVIPDKVDAGLPSGFLMPDSKHIADLSVMAAMGVPRCN